MTQDVCSSSEEQILDLVYAAIQDPGAWTDAVRAMAEALAADSAIMIVPRMAGYNANPVVFHNFVMPPPVMAAYAQHGRNVQWAQRAIATGRGPGVFHLDELMPPSEQAVSPFYHEVMKPLGFHSAVFDLLTLPSEFGAPPVILSFYRDNAKPNFGGADLAKLSELHNHMRRAIMLSYRPPETQISRELEGVLSAIALPSFLLDSTARVVFMNANAEAFVGSGDSVSVCDGKLQVHDKATQKKLDEAMAEATAGRSIVFHWRPRKSVEIQRPSGRRMFLSVIPLGDDNPILGRERRPRALVFALGQEARPPTASLGILKDFFGLSPAEQEVAACLAMGLAPKDIARRRGASIETVKSQIKAALAKTGLPRQAALVAFVACLNVN